MQTDRTTKTLLFVIALGLWANVLKPALEPTRSEAQAIMPVRLVGTDVSVPVAIVRQSAPLEVKTAAKEFLPVQIIGTGLAPSPAAGNP